MSKYLDAMCFVKDEPMIANGMNDAFISINSWTSPKSPLMKENLLSSFTVPPLRDQPFSCFRCMDSKLES